MTKITVQQALRYHLNYDPITGSLRWAIPPSRKVREGDAAGYITPAGYCYITVAGYKTTAARVAWFLGTGQWPERAVYAVNGDPADVRLSNLALENRKNDNPFARPLEEWTLDMWRKIHPDCDEWLTEPGQRAKRMLDLLS